MVGIVLVRSGSTRLPGKALARLGGYRVLEWVVERARRARRLRKIVVATTDNRDDDAIVDLCHELQVDVFRGSEDDVLGRFAAAARHAEADWAVRINGDNPFIDPGYIDQLIDEAVGSDPDYVSHATGEGRPAMLTPIGVFAEALSRSCLLRADAAITDPFQREHVTLGIYSRPGEYDISWIRMDRGLDLSDLRLTLDTPTDLQFLNALVERIGAEALHSRALTMAREAMRDETFRLAMCEQNGLNPKTVRPVRSD